ncbi:hopanoid-associated phosphorylase [Hyphomicrobium denitrificans 1NES1]|uniref:Hopanoid-associated phosphorylase n=1 Tax=Hyphomicrobium denitrificans 1NES1 TaxID=670307 RepID=N0B153_9HYPH|nr:phosphorylase [Hyphomicrobium denitrificans]AGK56663.1 hopanoid-associated phosphorylase [Hyphomicrobium denitrificans 1NES1]
MHAQGFVVAATGLRTEARVAEHSPGVKAVIGGGDEARLAALLERALVGGALGLISFGIAGALQPGLKPGTYVVGMAVLSEGQKFDADGAWTDRLSAALPGARRETVFGSSRVVGEVDAKAALYRATGAAAVDMESHIVARIATAHELPFAILRVIADSAEQRLPPAAVNGMKSDGTPDIVAVLKSLGSQPGQLPDLMRTAFAARHAMAELFRCHRLVGPALGFSLIDFG